MERLNQKINPSVFQELMELSLEIGWLREYSKQLANIWNLFEDENERELIKKLLERFKYMRSKDIKNITEILTNKIIDDWSLESNYSFFVAVSDDKEADGSQAFIQFLKSNFASIPYWKEKNFMNKMSLILELQDNCKIILIDDFVGTGKTANRKLKWVNDKLKEHGKRKSKIYFIAMAGMKFGINNIDRNLCEDIHVPIKLAKGISDYHSGLEKEQLIKLMYTMETKLGLKYNKKKLDAFRLGYSKSEALYTVEAFSTPNNVFPIFWWPILSDNTRWETFFKRL